METLLEKGLQNLMCYQEEKIKMTIQELENKYYFHDSMITNVLFDSNSQKLVFTIEFCNWAQEFYKAGEPELLRMELIFNGIKDYDGITGNIDYFSILDGNVINGKYHLFIEDDFHQEFYEYYLQPTDVDVKITGVIED